MASKPETLIKRAAWDNVAHPFTWNGVIYYAFTDGHYILACKNDYGYPHSDSSFDIGKLFVDFNCPDSAITVDRADVVAFKKSHPKRDKVPYLAFADGHVVCFNPYYLIDCIDWVNDSVLTYHKHLDTTGTSHIAPLFMTSHDNERLAMILPVKFTKGGVKE